MSKYFRDVPKVDYAKLKEDQARFDAMTEEEFEAYVRPSMVTHEDRLAFADYLERTGGGKISWDGDMPIGEYIRMVRAGEDLRDGWMA